MLQTGTFSDIFMLLSVSVLMISRFSHIPILLSILELLIFTFRGIPGSLTFALSQIGQFKDISTTSSTWEYYRLADSAIFLYHYPFGFTDF